MLVQLSCRLLIILHTLAMPETGTGTATGIRIRIRIRIEAALFAGLAWLGMARLGHKQRAPFLFMAAATNTSVFASKSLPSMPGQWQGPGSGVRVGPGSHLNVTMLVAP